jgi:hypothetical protein
MTIPRLHLFEMEDFHWFPKIIRNLMTDYLHFVETRFRLYEPIPALLKTLAEESGTAHVIDLCSGGAGPVPAIDEDLREQGVQLQFTLTDKYPNLVAFQHAADNSDGMIQFESESVDVANVPGSLTGIRTIFNGLHHFRPEEAQAIFRDAVDAGQPIATFEFVERRAAAMLPCFLIPLFVLVTTPAIRPRTFSRFLWTYPIPIVPLVTAWDGFVSHLRTYTPEELEVMTSPFPDYHWRTGRAPVGKTGVRITYLLGWPR